LKLKHEHISDLKLHLHSTHEQNQQSYVTDTGQLKADVNKLLIYIFMYMYCLERD